jgi:hypothetical protein
MTGWSFLARRRAAHPAISPSAQCVVPETAAPSRGAVVVVVLVLVLASVLFLAGYPLGAVLGLLAGGCGIATEAVRRLTAGTV